MNRIVIIDEKTCKGCGTCVEVCPEEILFVDEKDNVCRVTDETECDRGRGCEKVCLTGAIKIR